MPNEPKAKPARSRKKKPNGLTCVSVYLDGATIDRLDAIADASHWSRTVAASVVIGAGLPIVEKSK